MVGKVLAQYQISEKLGEGGMGVVWKARDARLDRFVALKTLSVEKLSDPERKRRFVQEAKAASALNHPNIVHIYDIADADGVQFIAMEYVAGKTLGEWIGRKGLRLNEALDMPGIWKVPVAGGEETRVLDRGWQSVWALTGQGICFFDRRGSSGAALKFHNFATGKVTLLRGFRDTRVEASGTALTVSPDGRWALYTQLDQSGSNLMLVENYQ